MTSKKLNLCSKTQSPTLDHIASWSGNPVHDLEWRIKPLHKAVRDDTSSSAQTLVSAEGSYSPTGRQQIRELGKVRCTDMQGLSAPTTRPYRLDVPYFQAVPAEGGYSASRQKREQGSLHLELREMFKKTPCISELPPTDKRAAHVRLFLSFCCDIQSGRAERFAVKL